MQGFFSNITSLWNGSSSSKKGGRKGGGGRQPRKRPQKIEPPAITLKQAEAVADPQQAFAQLQSDPQTFMRRNKVTINGDGQIPSGGARWFMVAQGVKDRRRRDTLTGQVTGVQEFQIMSHNRYAHMQRFNQLGDNDRAFEFGAKHVRMEQLPKGQHNTVHHQGQTSAFITPGVAENFITHSVSGCAITRIGTQLYHMQPSGATYDPNGNSQVVDTFASGASTANAIGQLEPTANVFGRPHYDPNNDADPAHLFIQSTRRGSVHIHGQQDRYDHQRLWRPQVLRAQFPAPPRPPVQPPMRRTADEHQNFSNQLRSEVFNRQMNRALSRVRAFQGGSASHDNSDNDDW